MEFAGKVLWLTGAGGRIGPEIARAFTRAGAKVALCDLDAARVERAAASVAGAEKLALTGDVSSEEDVARMLAEISAALGPVDVLVNGHGVFPNVPVLEMDLATWEAPFQVNTRGCFLTARAVARQMVERRSAGCIINLSSVAATSGRPGGAAYCASKAAIDMLTQVLAVELGPHGIRVNAVTPGVVTDEPLYAGQGGHPYLEMMIAMTPMGHTGVPSDVAEAVLALASERMGWVTGANLAVTGGAHCGRTNAPLTRRLGQPTSN